MEWDAWEGSLSSEACPKGPPLTRGPGLLPVISGPGLTLVFRGRDNGRLTLSPYPCPIICNYDRWQPGRAACEKGQRQWKDQGREKGAASGFLIQVTSEFWVSKMDKAFLDLPTQAELSLQPWHRRLWEHGCSDQLAATYVQGMADKILNREAKMPEVLLASLDMLWTLHILARWSKSSLFDLHTTLPASWPITLPLCLMAFLLCPLRFFREFD